MAFAGSEVSFCSVYWKSDSESKSPAKATRPRGSRSRLGRGMGVRVKALVAGIMYGEVKRSERASLPARDASIEEEESLMAAGGGDKVDGVDYENCWSAMMSVTKEGETDDDGASRTTGDTSSWPQPMVLREDCEARLAGKERSPIGVLGEGAVAQDAETND